MDYQGTVLEQLDMSVAKRAAWCLHVSGEDSDNTCVFLPFLSQVT